MDEYIAAAVVTSDESEAFDGIEAFADTRYHAGSLGHVVISTLCGVNEQLRVKNFNLCNLLTLCG